MEAEKVEVMVGCLRQILKPEAEKASGNSDPRRRRALARFAGRPRSHRVW